VFRSEQEKRRGIVMRSDDVRVVRGISLFSNMCDKHFDDLLQMAYLQSFPMQVQLITEGDPADFLHILVEGTVELFGSSNDRETTMFVLRPVSTFNLSAVLEDAVYLMSARTLERAKVLMVPAENVRKVMDAEPAFTHAMVMELAKRYRVVVRALKEQKLRNGVERLANYLLRANEQSSRTGQIELTEDRRTLAALLGITPEYLSRAFGKLRKYGVEVHGNKISLTNLDDLNHLAKPNPLIDSRAI
jgi:CRP/FNR family transcriptional activator FtrB